MILPRVLAGSISVLIAMTAAGEELSWEAVALTGPNGRQVIGKGVKAYLPAKDIVVNEGRGRDGTTSWSKSLWLDEAFAISASVHREPSLDGFGLVIYRRGDDNSFSWEWFDREKDNVFQKLQGSGRLTVQVKKGPGYEELESVEFLDDIVLRYLDDMAKPPGTHTHELLVRKGSVLRLAP
jgi:hypothetical protein